MAKSRDLADSANVINFLDNLVEDVNSGLTTKAPIASPIFTGTVTADGLSLGDSEKALFGDSNDLQIYHDGNHSRIVDQGIGALLLETNGSSIQLNKTTTENMALFYPDGAVQLFFDNAVKFSTTATGINVNGTATLDGLTVDGDASVITLNNTDTSLSLGQTLGEIKFNQNDPSDQGVGTVASIEVENRGSIAGYGQFNFKTGSATSLLDRLSINEGGDISFYEDTGTTPKFFWDASAESLGIGTSSPTQLLHLEDTGAVYGRVVSSDGLGNAGIKLRSSGSYDVNLLASSDTFKLEINGAERMRITSVGRVGIGTTNPGVKLEVLNGADEDLVMLVRGNDQNSEYLGFGVNGSNSVITAGASGAQSTNMVFRTALSGSESEALRIDSSGNVGIGTSSPSYKLDTYGAVASRGSGVGNAAFVLQEVGNNPWYVTQFTGGTFGILYNGTSSANTTLSIDTSGNVGIGTTSPNAKLHVGAYSTLVGNLSPQAAITSDTIASGSEETTLGIYQIAATVSSAVGLVAGVLGGTSPYFAIKTRPSVGGDSVERLRIDSSGNLLVGKTATGLATPGIELRADNAAYFTRANATAMLVNRETNDGELIQFRKDNATVGSIGVFTTNAYFGNGDVSIAVNGTYDAIHPRAGNGDRRSDVIDLGGTSDRFRDAHFSGTVNANAFAGDGSALTNLPSSGGATFSLF